MVILSASAALLAERELRPVFSPFISMSVGTSLAALPANVFGYSGRTRTPVTIRTS
ncbi:hypothetical protein BDV06DRAFT_202178 [Aspergillus oleicola]